MNARHAATFALLLTVTACAGSPTTPSPVTPPMPTTAALAVYAPTSWPSTCVQTALLCTANVTVTIVESAGVGVTVTSITTSFTAPNGSVVATANYDAAKITLLAGTNRVAPNGSLTIPSPGSQERIGIVWTRTATVGGSGTLTIVAAMTDDKGNRFTGTMTVAVS